MSIAMIGSSSMISTSARVWRSISASASATSASTSSARRADQIAGILGREALHRGQQQRLARQRRDPRQPGLGDALRVASPVGMAGILLDIGRRPDGVEGPVEAEPRIDVARKGLRRGDDRLERRPDESVAMGLAAGQGAGIAAKEGKVRPSSSPSDMRCDSSMPTGPMRLTSAPMQPRTGTAVRSDQAQKNPRPRPRAKWNNRRSFLFPSPRGPIIRGRRNLASVQRGRLHSSSSCRREVKAAGAALRAVRGE